ALDSKLFSINSINSQHLDKKEHEVKNVVEQPAERRNRAEKSLQNFRVVHKSFFSFKDTSQISSIHSIAPIQSTKELEHLLTEEFKVYSNYLFDEDEINSDKLDPHCFNVESDFVESLLRDTFIDFSSKFDFSGELAHIKPEIPKSDFDFEEEICLIENLLYDNSFPRPPKELNLSFDSNFEENPSIPRPPPKPPDVECFFDLKPDVIAEKISDKLNEDKCFDPGRE
nr:hypothetical protein [Tanacetum cinerariifolium]